MANFWEQDQVVPESGQQQQPTAPTEPPQATAAFWEQDSVVTPEPKKPNTLSQEEFRQQRGGGRPGVPQPTREELAARRGYETEGAPADLRSAYLKLPPGARNELADYTVNAYFSQRGHQGQVQTIFDEDMDVHLFKDPADGKWKPLNDLGMDWEDAKDIMKYVVAPTVGSIGAAAGGMAIGGPFLAGTAALLADTTIAGGFRANDVQSLIEDGLVPPEQVSPGVEGAREAAWGAVGFALGDLIGRAGRKFVAGVDNVPLATDVDRRMVADLMQRYDAQYGDKMPDLPLDKRMSLVANTAEEKAVAARVQARRESLERASATQAAMLNRREKNKVDVLNGLQTFTGLVGRQESGEIYRASGISMPELVSSAGRIIDSLEAPARAEMARYDQALTEAYQQADRLVDDLLSGGRDPQSLPTSFKGVFDAAEENFKANMTKQYTEIAEATNGQKVFDIRPLRDELKELRKLAQQDARFNKWIFGEGTEGLSSKSRVRIGKQPGEADEISEDELSEIIFGQAFSKDSSGLLLSNAAKREMADQTTFNYDAVNSALLSLRKRIREMPKGTNTDTLAQMKRIEQTLEDVRDSGLKSIDEGLASRQQALDATYKLGKETLDRGIGKKLADVYLQPRPGMEGLLKPSAFDKLFKGDNGAESVRDIRTLMDMDVVMAGPNNPIDMLGVRDNIRRGLLGQLESSVTDVGTPGGREARVITPEAFQTFKKNYKDALEFVFSPDELKRMTDATQMKRALQVQENKVKAVKDEIMQFPWGSKEIADDPAKLMRLTWPANAKDKTKFKRSFQLRDALREQGDPEGLLQDYRSLIAHDMMSKVSKGPDGFDPYALEEYLNVNQELLQEWYTSAGRSGTDMVEGLKAYANIGKTILEKSGINHVEKDLVLGALNSIARAYVGLFTTPGRILTAIKQVGGGTSMAKEADFILNPGKYIQNQEFWEILNSDQMRALTRAGGHALINSFRQSEEAEEAQSMPSLMPPFDTGYEGSMP